MILSNKSLTAADIIGNLGLRFRDYRLRLRMTRKEVAEATSIGMTTLYKFESGNMTDISFSTLMRLLKVLGLDENWDKLLPELPESPYLYNDKEKKIQRVRKSKKSEV
ncbi:MAG: helix-turn-helix transcriptional regulator [Alloprevotella sp.]|nr:helix-turn-helix domain-containing protein [Prevotellamassilia sp.]MDY2779206.1 helix-turn-helix transcriptional regulator [Alloprevotella sp.]MDY4567719.1 helix-turn-helix transcriptional regulator [Alloprevotella sp.]